MKKEEINKHELNNVISLGKKILNLTYIVIIVGIILGVVTLCRELKVVPFLLEILGVFTSFFIGFLFAWLFRPLVKKLNKKLPNALSSLLVFLSVIIIIIIFIYVFIPLLYNEVNELAGKVPKIIEVSSEKIESLLDKIDIDQFDISSVAEKTMTGLNTYITEFTKSLPNSIINIILSIFSGIGTFVMGLIIGLYMLMDYENIGRYFKKLLPKNHKDEIVNLFSRIGLEARKCVNGTLLVAFVVFLCDSIGFSIFGLDAPILFGLFCGITDLIPYIGPYIGGAAAIIVGFTQSTFTGISILIICIVVQLLESYVLQPIVMSKASNLHPVIIILGLLVFGHFFGIIGMIFATPCLAMLNVLLSFAFKKVKNKKELN